MPGMPSQFSACRDNNDNDDHDDIGAHAKHNNVMPIRVTSRRQAVCSVVLEQSERACVLCVSVYTVYT